MSLWYFVINNTIPTQALCLSRTSVTLREKSYCQYAQKPQVHLSTDKKHSIWSENVWTLSWHQACITHSSPESCLVRARGCHVPAQGGSWHASAHMPSTSAAMSCTSASSLLQSSVSLLSGKGGWSFFFTGLPNQMKEWRHSRDLYNAVAKERVIK